MHEGAFQSVSETDRFVKTQILPVRSPRKRELKALTKATTILHPEEERHKRTIVLTPSV